MPVTFADSPITGPPPVQHKTATQNPVTDICAAAKDVKTQDRCAEAAVALLAPCADFQPYVK
jgi:hypothetical protein